MRFRIFVLALACFTFTPAFGADDAAASAQTDGKKYDIGGGTTISVPKNWEFKSYFMPPDLKATNIRITAPGIKIAITGMLDTGPMKSMDTLTALLGDATKPYLSTSVEKEYHPVTADNKSAHIVVANYSANNKEVGLRVLPNERSLAVASSVVNKENAIYSISISMNKEGSEAQENFKAAIEAVKSIY